MSEYLQFTAIYVLKANGEQKELESSIQSDMQNVKSLPDPNEQPKYQDSLYPIAFATPTFARVTHIAG